MIPFLSIYLKELKSGSRTDAPHGHRKIIHSSPDVETTSVPSADEGDEVHMVDMLQTLKRTKFCHLQQHVWTLRTLWKWNKPVTEGPTLHDSTYIRHLKQPRDLPRGPAVKNMTCNAGDPGSIPGQRTKIPHATGQLSLQATQKRSTMMQGRSQEPQLRPNTAKENKWINIFLINK